MGPIALAITVLCESWLGVLSSDDCARAARSLIRMQGGDGGWILHPYAEDTTLGTSAVCRAALRACGVHDDAPEVRKAERRIAELGGWDRVRERFIGYGEPAAMFCAMVGLVPASVLPPLTPDAAALPWSERMLDGRVHAAVPKIAYAVAAVRERLTGTRSVLPSWLRGPTRMLARARLSAFIGEYQNEDGSWNDAVFNTVFALVALEGVGVGPDDPMMRRGIEWLETRKRRTGKELSISVFDAEVWETSFVMMALQACDVSAADPALERGARYLLEAQCVRPQPRCNQPKPHAPRTGGWAFQKGNDTMPDCDDTGVAVAALGRQSSGACTRELLRGLDDGLAWLRGMQNPSGGFPAYVHGMPDKEPGKPTFIERELRLDDVRTIGALVLSPPPELGDPAAADITGRVLWGLGEHGLTASDPDVARAIAFLERDVCATGAWFGIWNPPYVAATAFVLIGLASVQADLSTRHVERAVAWLLGTQNRDGGWGESYHAFRDPALAGRAPSMPPLTGIVLRALSDLLLAGAGGGAVRRACERAARYLLSTQRADGYWPDEGYLFAVVPPSQFSWDLHRLYYVLIGLGRWRTASAARAPRARGRSTRPKRADLRAAGAQRRP